MKLLTLCFPTFGKDNVLHLSSKGQIVLAPDEFHCCLMAAGWDVDVVAIAPKTDGRLFRSGLPLKTCEELRIEDYDLVWHMFRDATQPEVLAMLHTLNLDYQKKLVINRAERLAKHYKNIYMPVLERHGVGATVVDIDRKQHTWTTCGSEHVNSDRTLVDSNAYNNNRGDYPARGSGRVFTRFIDNARDGQRSIVRFGYAFGGGFEGFQFFCPEATLCFKTGSAKTWEPYAVPLDIRPKITSAMQEIGCDVCHVEAVPVEDRLYIIDVNPYPTADGKTLSVITQKACDALVAYCSAKLSPYRRARVRR